MKLSKRQEQKQQAIKYLGGSCGRCGLTDERVLQFHHKERRLKKYSISVVLGRVPFHALRDELDKCVLLCANCHQITHWELDRG